MIGPGTFVLNIPMLITAYLELALLGQEILGRNPNSRVLGLLKDQIYKGVQFRGQFVDMRNDIEVYIGFYLVVAIFLGWASLISIMVYW